MVEYEKLNNEKTRIFIKNTQLHENLIEYLKSIQVINVFIFKTILVNFSLIIYEIVFFFIVKYKFSLTDRGYFL